MISRLIHSMLICCTSFKVANKQLVSCNEIHVHISIHYISLLLFINVMKWLNVMDFNSYFMYNGEKNNENFITKLRCIEYERIIETKTIISLPDCCIQNHILKVATTKSVIIWNDVQFIKLLNKINRIRYLVCNL